MPESISLWLLFAVGLGGLGLLVVSFWRPHWGLALALIASYNPYYVYTKLNEEWWQGAGVRVIMGLLFLTTLAMAILLRWLVGVKGIAPIYRARTSIDSIGRFYVVFPVISVFVALLSGSDTRLMLADLFPFFEFYAYFYIAGLLVRDTRQGRSVLLAVMVAGAVTALTVLVLYLLYPKTFQSQWEVPRLIDFMPMLLLPCAVAMLLCERSRNVRMMLTVSSVIFSVSIVLGFWRTQWASSLAGIAFVLWSLRSSVKHVFINAVALFGVLLVVLFVVNITLTATNLSSLPIGDLIELRLTQESLDVLTEQGHGRVVEARDLWEVIRESPFIGRGPGGTFTTAAHTPELRDWSFGSAHVYYLGVAAMMGLPALVCLILSGFLILKRGMAILRQNDRTRAKGVKLCGLSSLVVLAFCAFAQAPVLHFPLPAYLGTLLAITFLAENPIKVSPKRMEMLSA